MFLRCAPFAGSVARSMAAERIFSMPRPWSALSKPRTRLSPPRELPVVPRHEIRSSRTRAHVPSFKSSARRRGHLPFGRPHRAYGAIPFDHRRKAARGDDRPFCFTLSFCRTNPAQRFPSRQIAFRAVAGKNLRARCVALLPEWQPSARGCPRCFTPAGVRRFDFFTQRRFEFSCILGAKRLRLQSQAVMQAR